MSRDKIGAVIIAKNEEAMIRSCVESLRGMDEVIVVVDSESHDGTLSILKDMVATWTGLRVFYRPWPATGGFGAARNEALDFSSCEWRLNIDADEVLSPGCAVSLRDAVAKADQTTGGITVRLQSATHWHMFPRCIRRGVRYIRVAHEAPDIRAAGLFTIGSSVTIDCGHSPAHSLCPDRALNLLIDENRKEGDACARTLYYLAREYWYRNQYQQALLFFARCLEKSQWSSERADAHLYCARMLWSMQRGDDARKECLLAIATNPNFAEAHRFMAEMSYPKNAEAWLRFSQSATNESVLFVRSAGT